MILLCYGTRPELIKLFPLAIEMRKKNLNYQTLFTGQHKHLIKHFKYMIEKPTYKFNIFKKGQSIDRLYSKILRRCDKLFKKHTFDLVIVQGDTASATAIAQSAFHHKIKIAHIEAGLRTYNKYSPFPEELNRHIISKLADYHFTPTKTSYENLIRENIINNVYLVGNTIVDAISYFKLNIRYKEQILITLHRRENLGKKIINLLKQINICAMKFQYTQFIFILHPNRKSEYSEYLIEENIKIIPPQNYRDMLNIMAESLFIITDSGGIQEEATCLGKKIIICRDTTERPEVVELGFGKLVKDNIFPVFDYFYQNYMIEANNPYGKNVSKEIVKIITEQFNYT